MKFDVEYELNGATYTGTYRAESAGEAFAKCLLSNKGCTLNKCRKIGNNLKGDPDPKFGITEWTPPPVQRQPEEPPPPKPQLAPKYKQTPDPMPAMQQWAKDHDLT